MADIILVPLDAKVARAPVGRVMIVTAEALQAALERINGIAETTGADPARLADALLADLLVTPGPAAADLLGEEVDFQAEYDAEIRDGRTITFTDRNGREHTEALRSFQHPGGVAGYTPEAAAQLKAAKIPKSIASPEFAHEQVL